MVIPRKKILIVSTIFLAVFCVGFFASNISPVKAQVPGVVTVAADVPRTLFQKIDDIRKKIAEKFKVQGAISFKSALTIVERKLLDSVKTSLATTGPGQKPLFLTNPKTFFKSVANSAAGDYIDDFTRGVAGGEISGAPLSGDRGKFLISRLLRSQAGQVISGVTTQCKQDCSTSFSTTSFDLTSAKTLQGKKLDAYLANNLNFLNDHEKRVAFVTAALDGVDGTNAHLVGKGETEGQCKYVAMNRGGNNIVTWVIDLNTIWSSGTMSLQDCKTHQEEALNIEKSNSVAEVNQCLGSCQARSSSETNAINSLTATDIFSSVQNADPRQAPAALANALSGDQSDLGQFLTAAGALTATVQEKVVGEQTNLNPNVLPVTTKVSGEVITPSTATSELFGLSFEQNKGQSTYTGFAIADVLKGIASFLKSPVGSALTTYFNTKCGLNPDACKGPSNARSAIGKLIFGSGGSTGVAGAQLLYATTGQTDIISGNPGRNEINITEQLASNGLIDAGFQQAIEGILTVKEALTQRLLDPQKTFGFDKNGIEPRDGYPYRALQYLRKFRVIPVGWELAARYSQEFDHRDLSLGYLTGRYGICGLTDTTKVCSRGPKADQSCQVNSDCGLDENSAAISCGASPYCGLIDPNWVLKAPQTYCRRQGAGEEIIAKEFVCDQNNIDATTGNVIPAGVTCDTQSTSTCTDIGAPNCVTSASNPKADIGRWVIERNSDTCADTQSCIAENEDGSCLAFGYCVQERQQFKFDGTQCLPQNSSCTSYTDPVGQQAAYLASTLDFSNCNADNAGCTQFCRAPSYDAATQNCNGTDTINFTAKVQQCSVTDAGCRQYLRTTDGANLLTNNSFEITDQPVGSSSSATVAGWTKNGGLQAYSIIADDSAITGNNKAALRLSGASGDALTQVVATGHALFERTFSFSIRAKAAASCSATLMLGPNSTNLALPHIPANNEANMAVTTAWDTYDVTLTFPDRVSTPALATIFDLSAGLRLNGCANQQLMIDSAQLEEVGTTSTYKDYGVANAIYLNSSKVSCTSSDVGCLAYTPTAGGSVINGQVLNSNRCSADKVGCATYKLEAITDVPQRSGGNVNIVAPKGKICSAADVGCEEYTNLDEVAQGGEGKEYFKSVKQCLRPSQIQSPVESATYYTWIGDAQLGYVLRSYDLVKSNIDGSPCTNLTVGSVSAQPRCDDARRLDTGASCNASTLASNPDCAQYYDAALATFYRLRSKTISITEDCHPYRNTIDQSDPARKDFVYYLSTKENVSCSSSAASCRAYTGNTSGTTRKVLSDDFETNGTSNWIGGVASNSSVNLNGHSMNVQLVGSSTAAVTQQKILTNQLFAGRTYVLTFTAAASSSTPATIRAAFGQINNNAFQAFNAGTANETTLPGSVSATWNQTFTPPGPEWRSFTLGPITLTQDQPVAQLGILVSGGSAFVDNVTLTEVSGHIYLIASSAPLCAVTDIGCAAYTTKSGTTEYLTSFSRLCSEQVVGCEALIDTQNSSSPFAQTVKGVTTPADTIVTFVNNPANYCPAASKGCEAVGRPTYSVDQKIVAYQTQYLINDPDRYSLDLCLNNELSCQAYTTADNTAAYFKDPGQRVCEFRVTSNGGGAWYITGTSQLCPTVVPPLAGRPIGASCAAVCRGGNREGQACLTNTDCGSDSTTRCVGTVSENGRIASGVGSVIGQCSSDAQCTGGNTCIYLAGSCAIEENSCTEYRDPSDPKNCRSECPLSLSLGGGPDYVDASCRRTSCRDGDRAGQNCQNDLDCQDDTGIHSCVGGDGQPAQGLAGCRSYFYLKQSIENNSSVCNGVVDPATGCRPFNDTTDENLNFRGQ